jgi:hypothetical protein
MVAWEESNSPTESSSWDIPGAVVGAGDAVSSATSSVVSSAVSLVVGSPGNETRLEHPVMDKSSATDRAKARNFFMMDHSFFSFFRFA